MRAVLTAALVMFLASCGFAAEIKMVCIKNACVEAEVAAIEPERERGLMFRPKLLANQGMLFIFDRPGLQRFWMKNTNFPLDIIWMDQSKTVVDFKLDAQPCPAEPCESFGPRADALYALEVNAGFVRRYGISVGDKVSF